MHGGVRTVGLVSSFVLLATQNTPSLMVAMGAMGVVPRCRQVRRSRARSRCWYATPERRCSTRLATFSAASGTADRQASCPPLPGCSSAGQKWCRAPPESGQVEVAGGDDPGARTVTEGHCCPGRSARAAAELSARPQWARRDGLPGLLGPHDRRAWAGVASAVGWGPPGGWGGWGGGVRTCVLAGGDAGWSVRPPTGWGWMGGEDRVDRVLAGGDAGCSVRPPTGWGWMGRWG